MLYFDFNIFVMSQLPKIGYDLRDVVIDEQRSSAVD